MTDEERLTMQMNKNVHLAPTIIALAWDPLFVWTISTMFFSQVKGLSFSQVVLLDSVLTFSGAVLCIICAKVFKNLSPVKSIRLGLLGYAAFLLLSIYATSFFMLSVAYVCMAFGYAMCGIKTNSLLNDSLTLIRRKKDYNRVYGRGMSLYFILESVGAIVITYVYNFDPYLSFWLSLAVVCLAIVLTFFATDTKRYMDRNVLINSNVNTESNVNMKSLKKDLFSAFVISLLLFSLFMRGATAITTSAYKIFLQQIQTNNLIKPWMFGYLFALCRITTAISCRYQFKLNLKYGIKTVVIIILVLISSYFTFGLLYMLMPMSYITVVVAIIMACIFNACRIPLQIFTSNYINNFVSRKNIDQIVSVKMTGEYIGAALGSMLFSALLTAYNDNLGISTIVFIVSFTVPLVISTIFCLKQLFVKFTKRQTIIKKEYTED